jgi:hypothetical protein
MKHDWKVVYAPAKLLSKTGALGLLEAVAVDAPQRGPPPNLCVRKTLIHGHRGPYIVLHGSSPFYPVPEKPWQG